MLVSLSSASHALSSTNPAGEKLCRGFRGTVDRSVLGRPTTGILVRDADGGFGDNHGRKTSEHHPPKNAGRHAPGWRPQMVRRKGLLYGTSRRRGRIQRSGSIPVVMQTKIRAAWECSPRRQTCHTSSVLTLSHCVTRMMHSATSSPRGTTGGTGSTWLSCSFLAGRQTSPVGDSKISSSDTGERTRRKRPA